MGPLRFEFLQLYVVSRPTANLVLKAWPYKTVALTELSYGPIT